MTDSGSNSDQCFSGSHSIEAYPPNPVVGQQVKFIDGCPTYDGNIYWITRFEWNFGDGSTIEGKWGPHIHVYKQSGTYRIEMTLRIGLKSEEHMPEEKKHHYYSKAWCTVTVT